MKIIYLLFAVLIFGSCTPKIETEKPPENMIDRYNLKLEPIFEYEVWGDTILIEDNRPLLLTGVSKSENGKFNYIPYKISSVVSGDSKIKLYSTIIDENDNIYNWESYKKALDFPIKFLEENSPWFGKDSIGFIEQYKEVGNYYFSIENYDNYFGGDSVTILTIYNNDKAEIVKQELYGLLVYYGLEGTILTMGHISFGGSGHTSNLVIFDLNDIESSLSWINSKNGDVYKN